MSSQLSMSMSWWSSMTSPPPSSSQPRRGEDRREERGCEGKGDCQVLQQSPIPRFVTLLSHILHRFHFCHILVTDSIFVTDSTQIPQILHRFYRFYRIHLLSQSSHTLSDCPPFKHLLFSLSSFSPNRLVCPFVPWWRFSPNIKKMFAVWGTP